MFRSTGHQLHLWCAANVDGKRVVRHGRAIVANYFLCGAVYAHHFAFEQTRTCKRAQAAQVDVHVVVTVVACNVAGQHAGIGGVNVGTNQR